MKKNIEKLKKEEAILGAFFTKEEITERRNKINRKKYLQNIITTMEVLSKEKNNIQKELDKLIKKG